MITAIIVILSVVFAAAFSLAYLTSKDLRRQIEQPKYSFQDQVRAYNRHVHDACEAVEEDSDGIQ